MLNFERKLFLLFFTGCFVNSWLEQTLSTFWKLNFKIQAKSLASRGQGTWCNSKGSQPPGKTMQTADCILISKTHMKRSISKPQKTPYLSMRAKRTSRSN